jgi:hypothetical protein
MALNPDTTDLAASLARLFKFGEPRKQFFASSGTSGSAMVSRDETALEKFKQLSSYDAYLVFTIGLTRKIPLSRTERNVFLFQFFLPGVPRAEVIISRSLSYVEGGDNVMIHDTISPRDARKDIELNAEYDSEGKIVEKTENEADPLFDDTMVRINQASKTKGGEWWVNIGPTRVLEFQSDGENWQLVEEMGRPPQTQKALPSG